MRQILQNLGNGDTILEDVPIPKPQTGQVLIRSAASLISTGTERMLVDFGKAGYLDKARQQPEKVRMVLDKLKAEGVFATYEAVKSKLDQNVPLGYANVGTILEVGDGVDEFEIGDRVVSNGFHAEFVCVGKNLCARVPDSVSDLDATFAVPPPLLKILYVVPVILEPCMVGAAFELLNKP